jgi:hypothetical protein
MVRRTSTVKRRGLTAYKVHELLMGEIMYPAMYYDGYGDRHQKGGWDRTENFVSDAMRQDWEANREALMAFWRSGKIAGYDTLAGYGLKVKMLPWLKVVGSRNSLPWAAKQFDQDDRQLAGSAVGGDEADGGRE